MRYVFAIAVVLSSATSPDCVAHTGHRLEVVVVDQQLVLHGYNNGPNDGGPTIRPYYNAIFGYWDNVGSEVAIADLPGFDVYSTAESYTGAGAAELLAGSQLTLSLDAAYQWDNVPTTSPFGLPALEPLPASDGTVISVGIGNQETDTLNLGTLTLAQNVLASGVKDIDPDYIATFQATDSLVMLEWAVDTTQNGIAKSQPAFTILAPNPTPSTDYAAAAIALERHVATPMTPGDFDRDGVVDATDYAAWKEQFGATQPIFGAGADGNRDGVVNLADYTVWRDNLTSTMGFVALRVPEPRMAAIFLLSSLVAAVLSKSWRNRV